MNDEQQQTIVEQLLDGTYTAPPDTLSVQQVYTELVLDQARVVWDEKTEQQEKQDNEKSTNR